MSKITEHLDKNNLHHAYIIEGEKEEILPTILAFLADLGVKTSNNPDFCQISIDNFKIDEALNLKSMGIERSTTVGKKVFIVSANQFSLDAQHALLKLFEEPIEGTHFFLITPDVDALIKTFVSRFYLIKTQREENGTRLALKFVSSSKRERIEFLKELLIEPDDEIMEDSIRRKSLKFLNELETVLHEKILKKSFDIKNDMSFFEQIFKVREYLRQPGSSTKSLMESVALSVPVF